MHMIEIIPPLPLLQNNDFLKHSGLFGGSQCVVPALWVPFKGFVKSRLFPSYFFTVLTFILGTKAWWENSCALVGIEEVAPVRGQNFAPTLLGSPSGPAN